MSISARQSRSIPIQDPAAFEANPLEARRRRDYLWDLGELLGCEDMNFLDMRSFSDESFDSDAETTDWYVVAGYLGTRKQWRVFERLWSPIVGNTDFHAAKLITGKGEFESWPDADRDDLQVGRMKSIKQAALLGAVAVMDMRAFRKYQPAIKALMIERDKKYIDAHVLTFKQYVQLVATKLDNSNRRISFICDRRPKGMNGRHIEWYNSEADNQEIAFRRRLGPIGSDTRHYAIALHAADMLAYCGFRHMAGRHTPWQWEQLNRASHILPFSYNDEFWAKYVGLAAPD